ncbi:dihydropteroate synthase [Atopobium minutum]|uniref:dihydropteroate synthase n=1 Tax=Atopobium minutum TaxID=1381 RepID=UPI00280AAC8B|nr:dihydropteroate synthase [Atopobium minutum]
MLRDNTALWRCGSHELSLSRPRIMGVLNVTPDSFSDGGAYADTDAAIARGMQMLDEGADIIDVGGESTRPGFTAVSPEEEAQRIVPVVRALVAAGAIVSVDTRHAEVARMCVRLGASIINDVTGFTDPAMVQVAADSNAGVVVMHAGEVAEHAPRQTVVLDSAPGSKPSVAAASSSSAGAPSSSVCGSTTTNSSADTPVEAAAANTDAADSSADKNSSLDALMQQSAAGGVTSAPTVRLSGSRRFATPDSAPIMRNVMGFLGDQARTLARAGVDRSRIVIDPGPGFGKLADEDVVIQRATTKMVSMGYPVLCAVSRKRFVGAVSGVTQASARDNATVGVIIAAVEAGARIVRVHDVAAAYEALTSYWTIAHPDERRAFVALGSNVGDRIGYLAKACALINAIPLTCVVTVSHAYETEPAYGIATPVANAVAEIKTQLAPMVLLEQLLGIENQLHRQRPADQKGHGPRTIDCDLVWMVGETHAGKRLSLPHPGLGERDYVLVPMEDIMRDPDRFLAHAGVSILPEEQRVGLVREDLGVLEWD